MPSTPGDPPEFRLRDASEDDYEHVYRITREAMKEYVEATWGWDEDQQRELHHKRFGSADMKIVLVGDEPVGYLKVARERDALFLKSLYLLQRWQSRGIGSAIFADLLREARERGIPVRLFVLKVNERARRLYERFGLEVVTTTETHHEMTSTESY
ncbi:MAG: GNAT family N-acetyltransferase [Planctomycetota bacterium]|jgi:GNAT superfamily N-acetyltransferase